MRSDQERLDRTMLRGALLTSFAGMILVGIGLESGLWLLAVLGAVELVGGVVFDGVWRAEMRKRDDGGGS